MLKALAVDPEQRFQDAATMGHELETLAARLGLRTGHGAVAEVMASLFGEQRRSRRRIARGSHDVRTDPSLPAISIVDDDDDKTPVVDLTPVEDPELRTGSRLRNQRPTTPTIDRARREVAPAGPIGGFDVAVEDLPTPPVERALPPAIALEDAPTSLAGIGQLIERPTPPQRSSSLRLQTPPPPLQVSELPLAPPRLPAPPPARVARHTPAQPFEAAAPRVPTGPQLPVVVFREPSRPDIADAPTHITGMRPGRDDPTDVSSTMTVAPLAPPRIPTATAELARPPHRWAPSTLTHAVVARVKPTISRAGRTWLVMCGLFVVAVAIAIVAVLL